MSPTKQGKMIKVMIRITYIVAIKINNPIVSMALTNNVTKVEIIMKQGNGTLL